MAGAGEPVEITILTKNISYITDTVTVGGALHWFANCLVEKAFIPYGVALGILGMSGVAPAQQAGQLLNSVFAKIRGSQDKRHWFNEFVDIFSHDRVHQDLVDRLRREGQVRPLPTITAQRDKIGKLDRDRDLGDAKRILVDYLGKKELRDLFRDLGLANVTLQNHFEVYGLNQYADDLLLAWINERDNVLNNTDYPGGATWENLRKALTKLGHHGAGERVLSLRPSKDSYPEPHTTSQDISIPVTSIFSKSSTSILTIDDLFDVKRELQPVVARWKSIGLALRLDPSQLDEIETDNRNASDCLIRVLTLWLNKAYNTERFGEPSWELLAKAVADPAGGNNPALAQEIGKKYGC